MKVLLLVVSCVLAFCASATADPGIQAGSWRCELKTLSDDEHVIICLNSSPECVAYRDRAHKRLRAQVRACLKPDGGWQCDGKQRTEEDDADEIGHRYCLEHTFFAGGIALPLYR